MPSPSNRKSVAIMQRLLALSIVGPLLAWMSFLWERCTGVTFVLSRNYSQLGRPSTGGHLQWSLILAIGVTVLAIPIFFFSRAALREADSGTPE